MFKVICPTRTQQAAVQKANGIIILSTGKKVITKVNCMQNHHRDYLKMAEYFSIFDVFLKNMFVVCVSMMGYGNNNC